MKKIVLLIFISLYFFKPIIPLVSYVVQYDYIVNELCENRADLSKECNGKCYLKKEMGKASDKECKGYKFPVFESVQFLEPIVSFDIVEVSFSYPSKTDFYQNIYSYTYYYQEEKPPSV